MNYLDIDHAFNELNSHGYLKIVASVFFHKPFNSVVWRQDLDSLLATLNPVDDQPGALRYHLSGQKVENFLGPWLTSSTLKALGQSVFGSDQMQVNYIRYREPLYGRGLQRLHRDWENKHNQRRLEVFIAFDNVTPANGCMEILDLVTGTPTSITLEPGCALVLDSSVLHRGTRNHNGQRRRVISLQIGPRNGYDSAFTCIFPLDHV